MRAFVLLCAVGCGGNSMSSSSTGGSQLAFGGTGTIRQDSFSASGDVTGTAPLTNDVAPARMRFSLAAGGRVASGDLDALTAAWANRDLRNLDGSELSANQVLTGNGTLVLASSTSSSINLPFDYTVEAYAPPNEPLLTLAIDATSGTTTVIGTLTVTLNQ